MECLCGVLLSATFILGEANTYEGVSMRLAVDENYIHNKDRSNARADRVLPDKRSDGSKALKEREGSHCSLIPREDGDEDWDVCAGMHGLPRIGPGSEIACPRRRGVRSRPRGASTLTR